tara:strand:- start:10000 stop:10896 length:897 start_codon:yes stop_codon:yes gene_type:complete
MNKNTHTLAYQLKMLVKDHKENSYATQYDRRKMLEAIGRELKGGGFNRMTPQSLKPKHIDYLVRHWKENNISSGSIKNRMTALRWWAEKVGKPALIPRSNKGENGHLKLHIEDRARIATESKGKELTDLMLSKVDNHYVQASLRLQAAFGLRRAESIMFSPNYAVRGSVLYLKASWCKSGRPRTIDIRTDAQRAAIVFAKSVAGGGALIPPGKNYKQQKNVFNYVTYKAGISNVHGFRHFYAQTRYKELTNRDAPVKGGLTKNHMSSGQKHEYAAVRALISQELGHERPEIVDIYLGR